MHALHEYVAGQIAGKLKERKLVVLYDPRNEFDPFIEELREGTAPKDGITQVSVGPISAKLAVHGGSMFELRMLVEPFVSGEAPETLLLYVPGVERDRKGSVLMELEKAGETYEPQLKKLARDVLRKRFTDGVIDELLAPDGVTYNDIAKSLEGGGTEPPSMLKAVFPEAQGSDGVLVSWLAMSDRDAQVAEKGGQAELVKLVRSRVGLELPAEADLGKMRLITARYVLAGEFRGDLTGTPPRSLESVPEPKTADERQGVRDVAHRFRTNFPAEYVALADRVEAELGLANAKLSAKAIGSIDTFRFEERTLLAYCGELIAGKKFDEAMQIVDEREHSFWLEQDMVRKAQWEACRRMAELGRESTRVRSALSRANGDAASWMDHYTAVDGWHRLDLAQRRLEAWVANLGDEPDERPLGVVRRLYEDACHAMAEGFAKALAKAKWTVPRALHQTQIFSEILNQQPRPVAYFLVDAFRYEMGAELKERIPTAAEVQVRPAVGVLPSITPIGMAALQPGAAGSFNVVAENGKFGVSIEGAFLPDLTARRKFAQSRIPKLVDLPLDELLTMSKSNLKTKVAGAQVIVVRSQEIDHAGEAGFNRQARRIMDEVIGDIASAIQRLARAGVEYSVVTADHGHLFFAADRDESMRIEAPKGDDVDLHRRCWIGRGGATPPGCIRVTAAELGYDSDLDFVFPVGAGVFKAGGDLAFHHGGPSLQELVVPVVTVRMTLDVHVDPTAEPVKVDGIPQAVTNRIFSVTLRFGRTNHRLGASGLDTTPMTVRPLLMTDGRQVGAVGMVTEGQFDRATGCVTLQPGKPMTVAFLLSDDSVPKLRVVIQDPRTDAQLASSDEIPVRLGV